MQGIFDRVNHHGTQERTISLGRAVTRYQHSYVQADLKKITFLILLILNLVGVPCTLLIALH